MGRQTLGLTILALWIQSFPIAAQSAPTPAGRPRIALVLSGGGARGAAHVGVLKVLEELQVPVDLVVGTSMGAIVGGLYAAGMEVKEMEHLFTSMDWIDLFTDSPSTRNLPLYKKRDLEEFPVLEVGFNRGKLNLPRGVIAGQKLGFLLKSLTLSATGKESFDELPIPFRAVATDLETGGMVVLDHGSLAQAVRASMSVPGVFPPVEIEGKTLVDGGIVCNLPVSVAKELGAELIIAVNVDTPLSSSQELESIMEIARQIIILSTRENELRQATLMGPRDVLIKVDMGQISMADFARSPEIIRMGEEAARRSLTPLASYSIGPIEYLLYQQRRSGQVREPIRVDFIKVEKPTRVSARTVQYLLHSREGGVLDLDILREDLARIYAIGDFEEVTFDVMERDGEKGLLLRTREKSWGPNTIQVGLQINDNFQGDSYYAVKTRYSMNQINRLGGEWRTDLQIGHTIGLATDFYQPLDFTHTLFAHPRARIAQVFQDAYSPDFRIGQYQNQLLEGGFDLGINLGTFVELRGGIMLGVAERKPIIGEDDLDSIGIHRGAWQGSLAFDQLDNPHFPSRGAAAGLFLTSSRSSLGADEDYDTLRITAEKPFSAGRHTLDFSASAGGVLQGDIPSYDEFSLGGFMKLSGYRPGQLQGPCFGFAMMAYRFRFADLALGRGVYLGVSLEAGNVFVNLDELNLQELFYAGSISLGLDTLLGPLYLGLGLAEGSANPKFYIQLGQSF